MTDPTIPYELPDEVERRFADLLAEAESAQPEAVEALCREFSEHESGIRARYLLATELIRDLAAMAPESAAGDGTLPEWIGPFRIMQRLGEGGMGVVYMAEQREPLQRRVAVKIIKSGMDSRRVLARFELERQVLSRMSHPGIARVLDAGITAEGRPWFAMEFVRGLPVTDFCDRHQLGVRERLDLMRRICIAVQYAHHKGVIHRDLKPTNILVTDESGTAEPKIIDFGLARATDQSGDAHSVFTMHGQIVGTPAYMSPEQAEMSSLDVDTRTDVYSLGIVLYELLTGATPVENTMLLEVGAAELQRRIREDDPPMPSSRASTSSGTTSEVAHRRSTDARGLFRALKGDLDWITLKALEKDRSRRYQTAQEFAADIERHLHDEPVLATPPSVRYRLGKLLRRYRIQATAAAVVVATGLGWLATSTWLYVEAEAARAEAQDKAEQASRVTDFLVDLFDSARLGRTLGEDISVRTVLDEGARRIERELADQPATRAQMMVTIADAYTSLGFADRALPLYEQAIETRQRLIGPDDDTVLGWQLNRGGALMIQGKLEETEAMARRVLRRAEEIGSMQVVARASMSLGNTLRNRGRMDEAGKMLERGVAMYRELYGDGAAVAYAIERQAAFLHDTGRFEDAQALFEEALAIQADIYPDGHPEMVVTRSSLSRTLLRLGDDEAARQTIELAVADAQRIFGGQHAAIPGILVDYAHFLRRVGEPVEAEAVLTRAIDVAERALGPGHPRLAWCLNDLGLLYLDRGDPVLGLQTMQRAIDVYRRAYPEGHLHTVIALNNGANAAARAGELDRGQALGQEALRMAGAIGSGAETRGNSNRHLAYLANLGQDGAAAERYARRALELYEGVFESDHLWKAIVLHLAAWGCATQGKEAEAETLWRDSIAMYRRLWPDGHVNMAYALIRLGALLSADRIDEAIELIEEAVELRRHARQFELVDSLETLGTAYLKADRFADAERTLLEALAAREGDGGVDGERALALHPKLFELYERWGKPAQARRYAAKESRER